MRKLEALLNPKSIALIGASKNFNKLNGRPLKFLLEKGYRGQIYPVNPSYDEIGGLKCFADVTSVPGEIDLAVVAVPARKVPESLRALAAKHVPAAVVFSSGFGELGSEGKALEQQIADIAKAGGIALCGPNTLGLINSFEHVMASFSQFANGDTPAGPVGFVTQSGAFGTAIAALARERGLGLGYFVNTGNEAGVQFTDVMRDVLADQRVWVGAGYIEGLRDGDGFVALAEQALEWDRPLVVTKVGRTGAGARAAASHTGSLAGEDAIFDGVCAQYGVLRARDEEHMLDIVAALAAGCRPQGPRVGLITQSGGAGVLMADRAEELGLTVTRLGETTTRQLKQIVPVFGSVTNPVDITAQFIAEPEIFRDSIKTVLADPEVDFGIVWFQLMHEFVDTLTTVFEDIRRAIDKPLLVCWVAGPSNGIAAVRELGFPVFRSAGAALDAARAVATLAQHQHFRQQDAAARREARTPMAAAELPGDGVVASIAARDALAGCGVPVVETVFCRTEDEASAAASRIGFPVAVKVESPDILHKTDIGGVKLELAGAAEVRAAFREIMHNAQSHCPEANLAGVLVQAMDRGDAVELAVGLKHDPVFGMVVMVGMGGIALEVSRDVAFRKAPVSEGEARQMLAGLRTARLLGPVRGRAAVDTAAVARLVSAVSRFGIANAERIRELDVNPVRATATGAQAVDWLLLAGPTARPAQ